MSSPFLSAGEVVPQEGLLGPRQPCLVEVHDSALRALLGILGGNAPGRTVKGTGGVCAITLQKGDSEMAVRPLILALLAPSGAVRQV